MTDRPDWPPLSIPSDSPAVLLWWDRHNAGEAQPEAQPVDFAAQVAMAYDLIKRGLTEIEVRFEIQKQLGASTSPKRAFAKAMKLLVAEQHKARATLPELVMALRMRAIQGALATGEYGAAARLLKDAGEVAQELSAANIEPEAAVLTVEVLPQGHSSPVNPAQPVDLQVEVAIHSQPAGRQEPQEGHSSAIQDPEDHS